MRETRHLLSRLGVLRRANPFAIGRMLTPLGVMLVLAVAMSAPGNVGGAQSGATQRTNVAHSGRSDTARTPLHAVADVPVPAMFKLTPHLNADDRRAMEAIARLAAALDAANWRAMETIARFAAALPPPPPEPDPDQATAPQEVAAAPAAPPAPEVRAPAPPPPAPAPAPVVQGLDTSPMNGYEQALFDDTNRRRAASGLPALRVNPALVGLARIRSRDMAQHNYFSHTSPSGDTAFALMDRYGVPYAWAGENLAKNNYPDAQCVAVADDALWNSAAHRENILGPHYTQAGVALAVDAAGMKYFTILFVG